MVSTFCRECSEAQCGLSDAVLLCAGTWIVEAVVGKGLHSVKDPKLLPAVKQYLKNLGIQFWEVPGMVVFNITPVDDSD